MSKHQGVPVNDITFCFSGIAPHSKLLHAEALVTCLSSEIQEA